MLFHDAHIHAPFFLERNVIVILVIGHTAIHLYYLICRYCNSYIYLLYFIIICLNPATILSKFSNIQYSPALVLGLHLNSSHLSRIADNITQDAMVDFGQSHDEELPTGRYHETSDSIRTLRDISFYGGSYSNFSVSIITPSSKYNQSNTICKPKSEPQDWTVSVYSY